MKCKLFITFNIKFEYFTKITVNIIIKKIKTNNLLLENITMNKN